jgi:hypothetical protein
LIVDCVASAFSSLPPAAQMNGATLWTRSNAFLPGAPNGLTEPPAAWSLSSVALNASQFVNAVAGSTPAYCRRSVR